MSVLRCAPSCRVEFNATPVSGVPLKPAGFRILAELVNIARDWPFDLEVTSGTEGTHSGPTDPHKRGEAVDVRSNNFPTHETKHALVRALILRLKSAATELAFPVNGKDDEAGWANDHFFAFLEAPGKPNEHIHVQVRKGTVYP